MNAKPAPVSLDYTPRQPVRSADGETLQLASPPGERAMFAAVAIILAVAAVGLVAFSAATNRVPLWAAIAAAVFAMPFVVALAWFLWRNRPVILDPRTQPWTFPGCAIEGTGGVKEISAADVVAVQIVPVFVPASGNPWQGHPDYTCYQLNLVLREGIGRSGDAPDGGPPDGRSQDAEERMNAHQPRPTSRRLVTRLLLLAIYGRIPPQAHTPAPAAPIPDEPRINILVAIKRAEILEDAQVLADFFGVPIHDHA